MNYPLPRNHFTVEWGGAKIGFCEVSGLCLELEHPAWREGSSPQNSTITMPGQVRYPHLVLKRPVIKGDNEFYEWIETVKLNTVERRDIVISLLNHKHEPVVRWKFKNAFPVKLDFSPLGGNNSEPMMETLEITHEGMTVEND
jgi:phage tail-like protein